MTDPDPDAPTPSEPPPELDGVTLELDGGPAVRVGAWSPAFDGALEDLGATASTTWVVLALGRNEKRVRKTLAKLDEALPGARSRRARIHVTEDSTTTTTEGLLVFDVPRRRARELKGDGSHDAFYWGAQGEPAERHLLESFDVDFDDGQDSMHLQARRGLVDARDALVGLSLDPSSARWPWGGPRTVVLGALAWTAIVALAYLLVPAPFGQDADFEGVRRVLPWVLHPATGLALGLGMALRAVLEELGDRPEARDLTAAESDALWQRIAPTHAALWITTLVAVTLLAVARVALTPGWEMVDAFGLWRRYAVITLWAVPAVAYASGVGSVVNRTFTAALWLVLALIGMRFALMIAGWVSNLLWGILVKLIPFELPAIVAPTWDFVIAGAAELTFAAYMLGYTWVHERKHFVLWLSDEITDD